MTPRAPRPASKAAIAGAVLALTLTAAACGGGDDEPGAAVTTTAASTVTSTDGGSPTTAAAAGEAPDATVSPDLPPELAGEVGPVQVIGDALPGLGQVDVADDPALGMAAPVLVGEDFDGNTVRIDAAATGPTMVVFLAHWCPHCNAEVPRLNELRDAGSFPEGLNIVAVSTATDPTRPNYPPSKWITNVDWTYPVIADGLDLAPEVQYIAAAAYGVDRFPFIALLDADGNVAARWSGEREPGEVLELISEHLGLG
jgi:cytochrome c biogenesis protein CcmG, thiol:disulfide interchange protein DsbE